MKLIYYSHPDFLLHDTGQGHPESPDRLRVIDQSLTKANFRDLEKAESPWFDDLSSKINLVHSKKMIDTILSTPPEQGLHYLDPDTVISPKSIQAALRAVSAVCDAVDQIYSNNTKRAFCAVRPPGHHATPDQSMGFCIFNNIAIAAEYARTHYHIEKIAIVDFDVHHGNGTQAFFYHQPQVMYASSHQMPHYPGTGNPKETGVGNIINVPLSAGATGETFRDLYTSIILPALRKFEPKLIFISAGFDAHRDDPLASVLLTEDDFYWVTNEIVKISNQFADSRIISSLEGGYNLNALANSVKAHVEALIGS